ncbi:MAG: Rne/Rng family ribonuclease, partial [Hyphomicrobiaceae bacterium]
LQAAFVDFGGNRHGFLAFNEIHPDYYQIPYADRQALLAAEAAEARASDEDADFDSPDSSGRRSGSGDESDGSHSHQAGGQSASRSGDRSHRSSDRGGRGRGRGRRDRRGGRPQARPTEPGSELLDLSDETGMDTRAIDVSAIMPLEDPIAAGDVLGLGAPEPSPVGSDLGSDGDEPGADGSIALAQRADDVVRSEIVQPGDAGGVAEQGDDLASPVNEPDFDNADATSEATGGPADRGHLVSAATAAENERSAEPRPLSTVCADDPSFASADDEVHASVDVTAGAEGFALGLKPEDEDQVAGQDSAPRTATVASDAVAADVPGIAEPQTETSRSGRDDAQGDDQDDEADPVQAPRGGRSGDGDAEVESLGNDDDGLDDVRPRQPRRLRSYKIQEVIKRRQVVLVQVVKEERGTKGAALTTYLSLAGRYTVLMPNTARGGGISRKITNAVDRKRLKAIAQELDVPDGMGLIIRTAGASRTKQEIKRDFEYLLRLWESVRDLTLESTAPALVYEEGNLIKRAIRDLYTKDIEEILVAGDEAYREAKDFMKMLTPSHAKNVIKYEEPESLFSRFGMEQQLAALFSPNVSLPSGGYVVINQTEALVSIDINSGRATREFSIEDTALKTNLEAATEIARQLRLRDLAGLIVIDFIDMDEKRNNRAVERRLKECLKEDRARIQVGRISHFGLLEMSRQRLRTGMLEGSTTQCPHCQGTGVVRSVESVALAVLRGAEDAAENCGGLIVARCAPDVAFYILNHKRKFVADLEQHHQVRFEIQGSHEQQGATFVIERPLAAAAPVLAQKHAPQPSQQPGHHNHRGQQNGLRQPSHQTRAQPSPQRSAVSFEHGFEGTVDEEDDVVEVATFGGEATREATGDKSRGRARRKRGGRRGGFAVAGAVSDDGDDLDVDAEVDRSDDEGDDESRRDGSEAAAGAAGQVEEGQGRRGRRRGRRGGQRNRDRVDSQPATGDVSRPGAPQPQLSDVEAIGEGDARIRSSYAYQAGTVTSAAAVSRRGLAGRRSDDDFASGHDLDDGRRSERDRSGEREAPSTDLVIAAADTRHQEVGDADVAFAEPVRHLARNTTGAIEGETAQLSTDASSDLSHGATSGANGSSQRVGTAEGSPSPAEPVSEVIVEDVPDTPAKVHWGEPTSTAPVVSHLVVGTTAPPPSETDAAEQKPQRKGWWQRSFG